MHATTEGHESSKQYFERVMSKTQRKNAKLQLLPLEDPRKTLRAAHASQRGMESKEES